MEADRFDSLVRTLSTNGTRRGLLRFLSSLPMLGSLATILATDSAGKGRRQRRKNRRRDRQKRKDQHRNKVRKRTQKQREQEQKERQRERARRCVPESIGQTCAGKCALVANNCGTPIDCGPCDCGPCPICQTCNSATGSCVPSAAAEGAACGTGGRCVGGVCVCDATSCPSGCCDGAGACHIDDDAACGTGGGACIPCSGTGVTCGGGGTPGECGCTPVNPCTAALCGTVQTNNCGQQVTCPVCPTITSFTATPATIDRGATPPETSTLAWATTNATTCSIDNGIGTVPCNGNTPVGPGSTTTYTLSATGPGGGPVTAQTTVTAQYCHAINAVQGGQCLTGATQFCIAAPIVAASSAHAQAACEACYGAGACSDGPAIGCSGFGWDRTAGYPQNAMFFYSGQPGVQPGEIRGGEGSPGCGASAGRWAP